MTQTAIPVELIALSGEHRISELEDIDALIRLHRSKVFRFVAFSVSDRDAAESITQDCFLKAHLTRDQFRGDCSISTWLMRIAFNLVRDHTKSQKFRFWKNAAATAVDAQDLSQYLSSGASSAEEQLIAKERVEMVHRTLQELTDKQRTAFVMRFVEEMDLPEIAAVTGMSVTTVKTHLYRAVGTIRARLGATL
jgi:RNA polymerase sigma-70 factor (ECF subfamily)